MWCETRKWVSMSSVDWHGGCCSKKLTLFGKDAERNENLPVTTRVVNSFRVADCNGTLLYVFGKFPRNSWNRDRRGNGPWWPEVEGHPVYKFYLPPNSALPPFPVAVHSSAPPPIDIDTLAICTKPFRRILHYNFVGRISTVTVSPTLCLSPLISEQTEPISF